jgi:acetyl-CoA carboxylase carboxyltransferase component
MGGGQAANTLLQIQTAGREVGEKEKQEMLAAIKNRYDEQTTPYYAAARLWVDDIIDPATTRRAISEGIAAANHNADVGDMKLGVFQV